MRKVCIVTGSRAEYGLLYRLMKGICDDPELDLQVIVTGMHLSPEFGMTYQQIEVDGFIINAKIEMLLSSDTRVGITKSVGLGVIGFADAFSDLDPDIVIVLGDRFEILAASQAAFLAGIALAHISGGEITEGAIDDVIRHCITKMAHYHFVATDVYRDRVIQLGELPEYVFNVGDPGLDNIKQLSMLSREELSRGVGFDLVRPYFLVTYHPTTTGKSDASRDVQQLFEALNRYPQYSVLITKANADMGGREVNMLIDDYAAENPGKVFATTSLGQLKYLSAMSYCAAVVGNSSSGIIEAPLFGVPTVNIGMRQQGRLKATSIVDTDVSTLAISKAIKRVLTDKFIAEAAETVSLYGECNTTSLILQIIKKVDISRCKAKQFYDLPISPIS